MNRGGALGGHILLGVRPARSIFEFQIEILSPIIHA